MRTDQITVGDTLKLKPERQDAYGKTSPFVKITAITYPKGYRTPWICSGPEAYRPSDFFRINR
jgi:hypothetical protein